MWAWGWYNNARVYSECITCINREYYCIIRVNQHYKTRWLPKYVIKVLLLITKPSFQIRNNLPIIIASSCTFKMAGWLKWRGIMSRKKKFVNNLLLYTYKFGHWLYVTCMISNNYINVQCWLILIAITTITHKNSKRQQDHPPEQHSFYD